MKRFWFMLFLIAVMLALAGLVALAFVDLPVEQRPVTQDVTRAAS